MFIKQSEEAKTDSTDGEAEEMEGLISTPFAEEHDCYNGGWDRDGDDWEKLHSRSAGRGAKDRLEVDWQEEQDPIEQDAIKKGNCEDDEGSSVVEEAGRCDWLDDKRRIFVDDESYEPEQTNYQRCKYLAGGPGVAGAAIGGSVEGGDGGADDDSISAVVDAGHFLAECHFFLGIEVQEDEEHDHCESTDLFGSGHFGL